jgi:hypothetical protein
MPGVSCLCCDVHLLEHEPDRDFGTNECPTSRSSMCVIINNQRTDRLFPATTDATEHTMVLGCGNKVWFAMVRQDPGLEDESGTCGRLMLRNFGLTWGPERVLKSQHKFITYSTHSYQAYGTGRIVLKLLTQMRDVNPDGMRGAMNRIIPNRSKQLGRRNYSVCAMQQ